MLEPLWTKGSVLPQPLVDLLDGASEEDEDEEIEMEAEIDLEDWNNEEEDNA